MTADIEILFNRSCIAARGAFLVLEGSSSETLSLRWRECFFWMLTG